MLDLDRVEGFDWDEGNERKSEERHRVSQSEAEQVFFSAPLLMLQDTKHSQGEPRFHALGKRSPEGCYTSLSRRERRERRYELFPP